MKNNVLITRRFAWAVALMWLAFLAQVALSYSGLSAARSSLKTVHELYMAQMEDLALMKQNIAANRLELLLAFQHDPDGPLFKIHDHPVGLHQDRLAKRRQANDETWARVKARCLVAGTEGLCAEVDAKRGAWAARVNQTQQRISNNDFTAPSMAAFLKAGREEGEALLAALDTLQKHQQAAASGAAQAAATRHNHTLWAALLLTLSLGLPALLLTEQLRRRLHRGFADASKLASTIAKGDLSHAPQFKGDDEISRLLVDLDHMRQALVQVIAQVRQSADSILTASSQVAAGNADLSERTEKTAGNLQQTASASEELGSTVQRNASSAHQANTLAQSASSIAGRGGEEVAEVVSTMRAIDQSARQIADITGVINGIAFQTNILALNAAVEAARAGEQGRGFAVVAAEVRTLAQRSAAAAKQISGLIESSVEHVAQGTLVADRAGATMQSVVAAIGRVSAIVAEISQASAEQSSGVTQVVQAVQQMDSATQQNAALVEQGAAAASSLSEQAGQLVQAVSVFKLSPSPVS